MTSNYSPASSNLSVECTQWCVAGYLGPDQCECIDCKEHIRQQLLRVHSRDRLVGRPQRPAVDPNKLKKQPNSENCQSQRLTRSAAGSDKSRYSPHEVAEATAQTTTDRSDSTYPSYGHHSRATRRTLSSLTEHKQSASTGDFGRVPTSIDQLTRKGHCGGTEIADKKYQQRTTPNGQQSTTKDASQRTTQNAQKVRTTPSSRGCSRVLRQPSHSQNSSALSGNSSSLTTSSLRAVVKRTPPLEDRASPMGRLSSIRQHTHTGDSRDYRGHLHSRRKDSLKVVAQMRVLSSQVVVPNLHAFGTPIRVIFACAISTCTPLRKIVSRCRILEGKRSFVTDFTTWMIIWAGLLLASILFKGSLG